MFLKLFLILNRKRLVTICDAAQKAKIKLLIDAEQTFRFSLLVSVFTKQTTSYRLSGTVFKSKVQQN